MSEFLKQEISPVLQDAKEIIISNNEEYGNAGEFLKTIKAAKKKADDFFEPIIKSAYDAHKAAVASKKQIVEPLDLAEKDVKNKMSIYWQGQERKRREEQLKIEAELKAQQEAVALRLAEIAEQKGDDEQVEMILSEAASTSIVAPKIDAPKTQGVSMRKIWKYRIVDAEKINRKFMVPNETAINKLVSSLGDAASAIIGIGGVEIYQDVVVSARQQ